LAPRCSVSWKFCSCSSLWNITLHSRVHKSPASPIQLAPIVSQLYLVHSFPPVSASLECCRTKSVLVAAP
jgi:hypothetical protein